MSQPLIVSIPHRLGRQEAKRRLDSGIDRLRPELGALVSGLDCSWQGDTLNFNASAMWQTITGRLEVLEDAVRIEIDLPWLMQLLGDTIVKQVRSRGVALLEKPPEEV
jgi:Putative polyhydroxyalkanoic acid system protein (PHA_gran_rgn)